MPVLPFFLLRRDSSINQWNPMDQDLLHCKFIHLRGFKMTRHHSYAFSCLFPLETYQEESVHFLSKVHRTCLQFFVPISRAMEQKLLKYVPCNTLNSDSSAPLHWTTEDSCSVTSSSPGRNLVGVWQREFPSVTQTYENKFIDYCSSSPRPNGHNVFLYSASQLYIYYRCTDSSMM